MRPVQLLGIAFACAAFAGVVTVVSMGVFQNRFPDQASRAIVLALIVFGITFIVVLLALAMLMLAIDPAEYAKPLDRPLLLPPDEPYGDEKDSRTDAAPTTGEQPPASPPDAPTP